MASTVTKDRLAERLRRWFNRSVITRLTSLWVLARVSAPHVSRFPETNDLGYVMYTYMYALAHGLRFFSMAWNVNRTCLLGNCASRCRFKG